MQKHHIDIVFLCVASSKIFQSLDHFQLAIYELFGYPNTWFKLLSNLLFNIDFRKAFTNKSKWRFSFIDSCILILIFDSVLQFQQTKKKRLMIK